MGFSLINVDSKGFSDTIAAPFKKGILYQEFEAEKLTCTFALKRLIYDIKYINNNDLYLPYIYRNNFSLDSTHNSIALPTDISTVTFCEVARQYNELADYFFVAVDQLLTEAVLSCRMNVYQESMLGFYFHFCIRLEFSSNQKLTNKYCFNSNGGLEFRIPCFDMLEVD